MSTPFADNVIDILEPPILPQFKDTHKKQKERLTHRGKRTYLSKIVCDVQKPPTHITLVSVGIYAFPDKKISSNKLGVFHDAKNREFWWTVLFPVSHISIIDKMVGPFDIKNDMWDDVETIFNIKMSDLISVTPRKE